MRNQLFFKNIVQCNPIKKEKMVKSLAPPPKRAEERFNHLIIYIVSRNKRNKNAIVHWVKEIFETSPTYVGNTKNPNYHD